MTGPFVVVALLALLAGLAVVIYRQWRQNQTLKAQLEGLQGFPDVVPDDLVASVDAELSLR